LVSNLQNTVAQIKTILEAIPDSCPDVLPEELKTTYDKVNNNIFFAILEEYVTKLSVFTSTFSDLSSNFMYQTNTFLSVTPLLSSISVPDTDAASKLIKDSFLTIYNTLDNNYLVLAFSNLLSIPVDATKCILKTYIQTAPSFFSTSSQISDSLASLPQISTSATLPVSFSVCLAAVNHLQNNIVSMLQNFAKYIPQYVNPDYTAPQTIASIFQYFNQAYVELIVVAVQTNEIMTNVPVTPVSIKENGENFIVNLKEVDPSHDGSQERKKKNHKDSKKNVPTVSVHYDNAGFPDIPEPAYYRS